MLVGEDLSRYVASAPAALASVRLVRRLADLERESADRQQSLWVLSAIGASGMSAGEVINRVSEAVPLARFAIWIPRDRSTSRAVPSLIGAGATDLIVDGVDVFWERVREILREVVETTIAARIAKVAAVSVHPSVRKVVEWTAHESRRPVTVSDLVRSAGVSERTLERRLSDSLGLTPKELIFWCRLLHALDARPRCRSWEDVAGRLGFSGAGQIRRMIVRSASPDIVVPGIIDQLAGPLRNDPVDRTKKRLPK